MDELAIEFRKIQDCGPPVPNQRLRFFGVCYSLVGDFATNVDSSLKLLFCKFVISVALACRQLSFWRHRSSLDEIPKTCRVGSVPDLKHSEQLNTKNVDAHTHTHERVSGTASRTE